MAGPGSHQMSQDKGLHVLSLCRVKVVGPGSHLMSQDKGLHVLSLCRVKSGGTWFSPDVSGQRPPRIEFL